MNSKISVFVIYVEAIIHLLLYNLHDCTFKLLGDGSFIREGNNLKHIKSIRVLLFDPFLVC